MSKISCMFRVKNRFAMIWARFLLGGLDAGLPPRGVSWGCREDAWLCRRGSQVASTLRCSKSRASQARRKQPHAGAFLGAPAAVSLLKINSV